ncbi:GRASP65 homolog protein 1 [Monosporozyma servazzii]
MFRIAKNIVKTFEQTVSDTVSGNSNKLDAFFQSIPPNLITSQFNIDPNTDFNLPNNANEVISGLRIIYVEEWQLQLQSFFDYIVGINDLPLPMYTNNYGFMYPDYNAILNLLNDSVSSGHIKLNIWSVKGGNYRDEYLSLQPKDENDMDSISLDKPTTTTAAGINITPMFQSLGIKVQWTPLIASTFTYHILQLNIPNGPAQVTGLIPDEDYIIGCQDGLLATGGNELLPDVIRSRANQSLVLYIYNKVSDSVRPITVNIGPDGRLGCNIGYGFLHRIPSVRNTSGVNDKIQSTHIENTLPPVSDSSFVPSAFTPALNTTTIDPALNSATIDPIASAIAPPPRSGKKKKHVHSTANAMNDYFNEGVDPRTQRTTGNTPEVTPPPIIQH